MPGLSNPGPQLQALQALAGQRNREAARKNAVALGVGNKLGAGLNQGLQRFMDQVQRDAAAERAQRRWQMEFDQGAQQWQDTFDQRAEFHGDDVELAREREAAIERRHKENLGQRVAEFGEGTRRWDLGHALDLSQFEEGKRRADRDFDFRKESFGLEHALAKRSQGERELMNELNFMLANRRADTEESRWAAEAPLRRANLGIAEARLSELSRTPEQRLDFIEKSAERQARGAQRGAPKQAANPNALRIRELQRELREAEEDMKPKWVNMGFPQGWVVEQPPPEIIRERRDRVKLLAERITKLGGEPFPENLEPVVSPDPQSNGPPGTNLRSNFPNRIQEELDRRAREAQGGVK